jgi:hypothetical protein
VGTDGTPAPRYNIEGGLVYDARRKLFVLFGGRGVGNVPLGDTWTFDLATRRWRDMQPKPAPSARELHAMSYDEALGVVVLYGGRAGTSLADTWVYDAGRNTWTELPASDTGAPAMHHHSMAYDPTQKAHVAVPGIGTHDTLALRLELEALKSR